MEGLKAVIPRHQVVCPTQERRCQDIVVLDIPGDGHYILWSNGDDGGL